MIIKTHVEQVFGVIYTGCKSDCSLKTIKLRKILLSTNRHWKAPSVPVRLYQSSPIPLYSVKILRLYVFYHYRVAHEEKYQFFDR